MKDLKTVTRRFKQPIALILAVLMAISIVLSVDIPKGVNAAYYKTFTKMETYKIGDKNSGYYMVPDQPGKYPVLFLFHGAGQYSAAPTEYKRSAMDTINKWIALGYMDPMIVIMPEIGVETPDDYWAITANKKFVTAKRFEALMDSVRNGDFTDKVDTTKKFSAAGFSQGGSTALYVGTAYPDDVINVGAASPSWCYYQVDAKGNEIGYVKKSEIKFSKASNAHLFIGNGTKEDAQFPSNVSRYLSVYSEVKGDNPNNFVVYNTYASGHNWETFKREIFYFLYYTKFDTVPTSEIIEEACKNSNLDYEPYDPSQDEQQNESQNNAVPVIESVTPSISNNTVDMGQFYTINVKASGSNLKYQWMWRTDDLGWATSKCPGNDTATITLEGKRPVVYYKCVVSNEAGSVETNEIPIYLATPGLTSSVGDTVARGQAYTISSNVKDSRFTYSWEYNKHDDKGWLPSQVADCNKDTLHLEGKNPVITYRCTITYYDGNNTFTVTSDEITITMPE